MSASLKWCADMLEQPLPNFLFPILHEMAIELVNGIKLWVALIRKYAERNPDTDYHKFEFSPVKVTLSSIMEEFDRAWQLIMLDSAYVAHHSSKSSEQIWEFWGDKANLEENGHWLRVTPIEFIHHLTTEFRKILDTIRHLASTIGDDPNQASLVAYISREGKTDRMKDVVDCFHKAVANISQWLDCYEAYAEKLRHEGT